MENIKLTQKQLKEIKYIYEKLNKIQIEEAKEKELQCINVKLDLLLLNLDQFVRIIFKNNYFNQFKLKQLIGETSQIDKELGSLDINIIKESILYFTYKNCINKIQKLLQYFNNVKKEWEIKTKSELLQGFHKTVKKYGWNILNEDLNKKIRIVSKNGFEIECDIDHNIDKVYENYGSVKFIITISYGGGYSKRFLREKFMSNKFYFLSYLNTWIINLEDVKWRENFENVASQLFISHGNEIITFKDNYLVYLDSSGNKIREKEIHPLKIQYIRESPKKDGILILFEKPDNLPIGKKFFDLGLFSYNGKNIWWADYPKSKDSDYHLSLEIINDKIYTETFSSYTCQLNPKNGKIIKKVLTK